MTTPHESAARLLDMLRERGLSCATAESCTGGNIAHRLTLVAGSSDVYAGGVVSYSNQVKENLLGVEHDTLQAYGAVSRQVVEQMAEGACRVCSADCAMATSGIAGPGGAVPGKPVGTVWIAARAKGITESRLFHFEGNRSEVIEQATGSALQMLSDMLCN